MTSEAQIAFENAEWRTHHLSKLSPPLRIAIDLYSEGYSPHEIATKLGVSRDAIYQRHKRAADVLKKSIARESRSF